MENSYKENLRVSFLKEFTKGIQKNKEWIPVFLCSFPVIATGVYRGGEPALASYLLGLYLVFLVFYSFIKEEKVIIERNIFFIPIAIFVVSSFIITIFSPALISSFIGFIEYFSYFLFFLSLIILKPRKINFCSFFSFSV